MRRLLALLLICAMLLSICSCAASDERTNPITFYYKRADVAYGEDSGVLYGLDVDLEDPDIPMSWLISQYFEGPDETYLESPFPPGTHLVQYSWIDELLTLTLSNEFAALTGLDATIAMACLTKTLTQIQGVEELCVLTEDGSFSWMNNASLTDETFVLYDAGAESNEAAVNLYFADEAGRFLLRESLRISTDNVDSLPSYVLSRLIAGSQQEELGKVIPSGTILRSVSVREGVCYVDFSENFLLNKPQTAIGERLTIYAIVNSLTELESIDTVQITVEGQTISTYLYMDLSGPLARDESMIGPIREGLNEFDATIYVYSETAQRLVGLPVRLRRSASQTEAYAALSALIQYQPPAGLSNAVPAQTRILNVNVTDGLCTVNLSPEFLDVSGSYIGEHNAVRAVVATLCALTGIRRVQLQISGRAEGLQYYDISAPLVAQHSWSAQ